MAGYISFYKLDEWFSNTFSSDEQKYMIHTFQPFNSNDTENCLTSGTHHSDNSCSAFLVTLIGWFYNKNNIELCKKIATKAEESFSSQENSFIETHFYYQGLIQFYYKIRDTEGILEKVICLCNEAISIAPKVATEMKKDFPKLPRHIAYEQLAIILKKKKDWKAVIDICKKAKKEKWNGDWDKRINEAELKIKNDLSLC